MYKKESRVTYASQPGCSSVVGNAYRPLKYISYCGTITYILCRGEVWIACNFDRK